MKPSAKILIVALAVLPCLARMVSAEEGQRQNASGSGSKPARLQVIDVPIPIGHDASGIKLPVYNEDGKLQMSFAIQMAKRVDKERLEMGVLKLETFDESGQPALSVEMEKSVLNLKTRVITSDRKTTVKRSDFEISGTNVEFDTNARTGRFIGATRMLVYNLE
jgi:lipopolysaccharide export system protein LptC